MKKIVLLGDSITEGFDINKYFPGLNIVNKGIYGDNSDGVLARLNRDVIELRPDIVFILIGTNDFACGKTNQMIINNLTKIIKTISSSLQGTTIYLASILPVRALDNRNNTDIQKVNREMQSISKNIGINYFDLYPNFLDSNSELASKYSDDGLHLTAEGYKKWGRFATAHY